MKHILNRLINHEQLSKDEARAVLVNISEGKYNQSQIAAFLTVYMMRNVSLEELEGFRDALLDLCLSVDLSEYNTIDLCGTGGDGKNTFNISTLASFVSAGAGIKVTKHGNYGVSSVSGSSNVMEALGIKFSNEKDFLKRSLDEAGICVLHAPLFHPAMKYVAPIRKELAVKTFFNMLGPMVNPAFPKNQLVGVFDLELARMYGYLYQKSEKNYAVLHAMDGYDEISLTGLVKVISKNSRSEEHTSELQSREKPSFPTRRSSDLVKTFFNMLGPMVNPAFPKNQLVGVFDLELARMYGYLYQKSEKNYAVLHAMDGYDEISLTGLVKVISKNS